MTLMAGDRRLLDGLGKGEDGVVHVIEGDGSDGEDREVGNHCRWFLHAQFRWDPGNLLPGQMGTMLNRSGAVDNDSLPMT